jgi:hypothetical protein
LKQKLNEIFTDQITHIRGNEKFIEGLRALMAVQPGQYIGELMKEKQHDNQLVKQRLKY